MPLRATESQIKGEIARADACSVAVLHAQP